MPDWDKLKFEAEWRRSLKDAEVVAIPVFIAAALIGIFMAAKSPRVK